MLEGANTFIRKLFSASRNRVQLFFSSCLLTLCLALAHEMCVSHFQAEECKTHVSFTMTFFFCLRDYGAVWGNDNVVRGRTPHQSASLS